MSLSNANLIVTVVTSKIDMAVEVNVRLRLITWITWLLILITMETVANGDKVSFIGTAKGKSSDFKRQSKIDLEIFKKSVR